MLLLNVPELVMVSSELSKIIPKFSIVDGELLLRSPCVVTVI